MENNKKNKQRLPATVWVFLAFILIFTLANLFAPKREFSPNENRMLAEFPKFSFKKLFNEGWTQEYETYVTDQFVLRDTWVGIKAGSERALLKTENGGIYFAKEDTLIERPASINSSTVKTNISSINTFRKTTGANVTFALIPNTICINSELLPAFASDGEQTEAIRLAYGQLEDVASVDIVGTLADARRTQPYIYYRTDHHPTSLGAYYIYSEVSKALGYTPHELSEYNREAACNDFYGTARSQSGAWWVEPDTIEFFTLPDEAYCLTVYENDGIVLEQDSLYVRDRLDTVDKYTAFLGGNHPLTIITNENADGGKLLLVKDSFSHTTAPFLADHYSEIHLVDLRYYRDSLITYLEEQQFTDVLIMYSVDNFLSEKNLVYLNL